MVAYIDVIIAAVVVLTMVGIKLKTRSFDREPGSTVLPKRYLTSDVEELVAQWGGQVRGSTGIDRIAGLALPMSWKVEGRHGDFEWKATIAALDQAPELIVEIDVPTPAGASIGTEGFFGGRDPTVGSEAFDSVVKLAGDPAWLSAALDGRTRRLLLSFQGQGAATLRKGRLRLVTGPGNHELDTVSVGHRLAEAFSIAAALSVGPEAVPGRLLVRARATEGRPSNLAAWRLLARYGGSSEAAEFIADAVVEPTTAALGRLVRGAEGAEAEVTGLLRSHDAEVVDCAIEALRRRGTAGSVEALGEVPSQHRKAAEAAVAVIQARIGDLAAGGLALSAEPPDGGQLSVAAGAEEGALSPAEGGRRRPKQES